MSGDRPQNKHLRPNPRTLGVIPLKEGETSNPVRIRAPEWVHARLRHMTAAEIGSALTRALRDDDLLP